MTGSSLAHAFSWRKATTSCCFEFGVSIHGNGYRQSQRKTKPVDRAVFTLWVFRSLVRMSNNILSCGGRRKGRTGDDGRRLGLELLFFHLSRSTPTMAAPSVDSCKAC